MKLDIKIGDEVNFVSEQFPDAETGPKGLQIDGGTVVEIIGGKVRLEDGRLISKGILLSEESILKMGWSDGMEK